MREAYSPDLVGAGLIVPVAGLVGSQILILRHQLNIQRRHQPKRLAFSAMDRLIFVGLYRLVPNTTLVTWDRDRAYGEFFVRGARSIGIRDRPTSFRSPWQNACAERLIGSIRRECTDHIVIFGERDLRHVLPALICH
jgi:transposase InsO family protein